jgi:hypothetical protein
MGGNSAEGKMSETERECAANYRKPPLHTRVKTGQSGNLHGAAVVDYPQVDLSAPPYSNSLGGKADYRVETAGQCTGPGGCPVASVIRRQVAAPLSSPAAASSSARVALSSSGLSPYRLSQQALHQPLARAF